MSRSFPRPPACRLTARMRPAKLVLIFSFGPPITRLVSTRSLLVARTITAPYQFPEKLIPLFITNALAEKSVPVYGDGRQVRDWIHVLDHCRGIDAALRRGRAGEVYNLGGKSERYNIDVTRTILGLCGKTESLIQYVTDRLGHDRRYAINCSKAEAELGWRPTVAFRERPRRYRRVVQDACRLDRTCSIGGISKRPHSVT